VGGKFYLPYNFEDEDRPGNDGKPLIFKMTRSPVIAAGAVLNLDRFSLTGRIDASFGNYIETRDWKSNSGFFLETRLVPSWDFGFLRAGIDFGFSLKTGITVNDETLSAQANGEDIIGWGIGAFVHRNVGNCWIKTGVAYNGGKKQGDTIIQIPAFSIPAVIEINF
jgi:hypothetical protein